MKFLRYLDNRYQECEVEQGKAAQVGGFLVFADAEQNACKYWMWIVRTVLGLFLMPKVIGGYTLVQIRLLKPPMPAIDLLRAQHAKGMNKKAKKLGFKEKEVPPVPEVNA